jgi:hypothetical protein
VTPTGDMYDSTTSIRNWIMLTKGLRRKHDDNEGKIIVGIKRTEMVTLFRQLIRVFDLLQRTWSLDKPLGGLQ